MFEHDGYVYSSEPKAGLAVNSAKVVDDHIMLVTFSMGGRGCSTPRSCSSLMHSPRSQIVRSLSVSRLPMACSPGRTGRLSPLMMSR